MSDVLQQSFVGGMNLQEDETRIADDQYVWLINGRVRFGVVEPIKQHKLLSEAPAGLKQGIYGFGEITVLFCAGKAYYKRQGLTWWSQIPDLQMSAGASTIYAEAVPTSTFNLERKSDANDVTAGVIVPPVVVSGTPAALVVQDGVSEPWLIFPNGLARKAQNFYEWNAGLREYVPKGRQMLYFNGILYIVSPDGTKIYRSVTGRPLDFMVAIDSNGGRLSTLEAGGADALSFAVDSDVITSIKALNAESFMVSTNRNSYAVTPNRERLIYAEPQFDITPLFNAGVVNQFSVVEILGDFALIDFEGIKSFNAVMQLRNEGRNSPLSFPVSPLFRSIRQSICAAISFDNYAFFAMSTTWGHGVLVYDMLLKRFVAFDLTTTSKIKQFATTYDEAEQKLYCITDEDEVYEMFGETTTESAYLKTKALSLGPRYEVKAHEIRTTFADGDVDGTVFATDYVDGQKGSRLSRSLVSVDCGVDFPVDPPVLASNKDQIQNLMFNFHEGRTGQRVSYVIQWTNNAKLTDIFLTTRDISGQQSQAYG